LDGIQGSTHGAVVIVILLAGIGVVVKALSVTGLAQNISFIMLDVAAGRVFVMVILSLVVCALFGMAVAPIAAYIFVVILSAPALEQLGVPLICSHFAILYIAVAAGITPPVAGIVAITSGIAKSGYLETCWESLKFGCPLFILPLVFIYRPELLTGSSGIVLLTAVQCFIGMAAIAFVSYFPGRRSIKHTAVRLAILPVLAFAALFAVQPWLKWGATAFIIILAIGFWLLTKRGPRLTQLN